MHWLYAPGTNSYLPQLARYCGNVRWYEGVQAHTINNQNTANLIGRHTCVKFPEIIDNFRVYQPFNLLFCLFCMLRDWCQGVTAGTNSRHYNYSIDLMLFNLGQTDDIDAVHRGFRHAHMSGNIGSNIILYGVSRGSAALINWLASPQFQQSHSRQSTSKLSSLEKTTASMSAARQLGIQAIVLEGCPSSLDDLVNYSTGLSWLYYKLVRAVLPWISRYRADGPQAIDNVTKLPRDIPILFITSYADKTVPYMCTTSMYEKMVDAGYTNVHIVTLSRAGHDNYLSKCEVDRQDYIAAVLKLYSEIPNFSLPNLFLPSLPS